MHYVAQLEWTTNYNLNPMQLSAYMYFHGQQYLAKEEVPA